MKSLANAANDLNENDQHALNPWSEQATHYVLLYGDINDDISVKKNSVRACKLRNY